MRKNSAIKNEKLSALFFVLPSYSIYFIFVFIPIIVTIYLSFTNYNLYKTMDWVGLSNYFRLTKDPIFIVSLKNTLFYAAATIIPQIVIGLILAVLLNRNIPGKKFYRVSFYIPNVTSMVSIAMVWLWIYDPAYGVMNQFMKLMGIMPQKWLYDINLALPSIIIMSIWKLIGYNMIIYIAALQHIPNQLYEAADVDGASKLRQFFQITVPMLKPTTFFLFVIGCVNGFTVFEQVMVMTQGNPLNATTTVVHQIYERAFKDMQMGYASAMAVFLLVFTIILTMVNFKYGESGAQYDL